MPTRFVLEKAEIAALDMERDALVSGAGGLRSASPDQSTGLEQEALVGLRELADKETTVIAAFRGADFEYAFHGWNSFLVRCGLERTMRLERTTLGLEDRCSTD